MRKIAANIIFTVSSAAIKNGYIEIDSSGKIINISGSFGTIPHIPGLEYYNGVLIPGIIIGKNTKGDFLKLNSTTAIENKISRVAQLRGIQAYGKSINKNKLQMLYAINYLINDIKKGMTFTESLKKHTLIAAEKAELSNELGSLEIGKNPGILLVSGFNFSKMSIDNNSVITRIV